MLRKNGEPTFSCNIYIESKIALLNILIQMINYFKMLGFNKIKLIITTRNNVHRNTCLHDSKYERLKLINKCSKIRI